MTPGDKEQTCPRCSIHNVAAGQKMLSAIQLFLNQ